LTSFGTCGEGFMDLQGKVREKKFHKKREMGGLRLAWWGKTGWGGVRIV